MSVTSLRRAPSPATPASAARTALAERIAEFNTAETAHHALVAALEWDGAAVRAEADARDRLEAAEAAMEIAKGGAADHLVNLAMGETGTTAPSLKDARAAIAAAEDDLNTTIAARQTLAARLAPAESAMHWARGKLDDAAADVVREHVAPDLDALFIETDALYRRAAENSNLIAWLIGPVIPMHGPKAHPRTVEISCRFTSAPSSWGSSQPRFSASRAAWQAGLEALKIDANAKLPDVVKS